LHKHLLRWIVPFLVAVRPMAQTPFYRNFCDFTIEFLLADYSYLIDETGAMHA
jgi:TorA maturation chaperone TorD